MAKDPKATQTAAPAAAPAATPEKKGMSDETKKKLAARLVARNDAKARVLAFLGDKENAEQLGSLVGDIKMFLGGSSRSRSSKGGPALSPTKAIGEMIVAAGKKGVAEIDIYKAFHIGRPEMNIKRRVLVQAPKEAKDRVYITLSFPNGEAEDGLWTCVGQGTEPKDWDGWKPGAEL